MLKIAANNRTTVTARVNVRDEAGNVTVVDVKLTGLLRSQDDWDALFARHESSGESPTVTDIYRANAALYAEVFDGWQGPLDAAGQPLPYSPDAVSVLLTSEHGPAANAAFMQAVHELRFGAVEKN